MSGYWAIYQQWCLTDMPNCSRAIRMTSLVLSVLLTASVLAWRDKRNFLHLQNLWLVAMLVIKTGKFISWKKRQRKEENLTYAQFPISFANIFRGIVLGSSFSFPSIIRLRDGNLERKRTRIGHHENKKRLEAQMVIPAMFYGELMHAHSCTDKKIWGAESDCLSCNLRTPPETFSK